MANYIDNLITFIDRQRTLYNIDALKDASKDVPAIAKHKYLIKGREFDHVLDLNALERDEQITYCPDGDIYNDGGSQACTVSNYFHFDGTPVVDAEDFDKSMRDEGIINVAKILEFDEMSSSTRYSMSITYESEQDDNDYFIPPMDNYLTFDSEDNAWKTLSSTGISACAGNTNSDLDFAMILTPAIIDGYLDADAKLYFNLLSEQNLSGIYDANVYDTLVVHDIRTMCATITDLINSSLSEGEDVSELTAPLHSCLFRGSGDVYDEPSISCGYLTYRADVTDGNFNGVTCEIALFDDDGGKVIETLYPEGENDGFEITLHDFRGHYLNQHQLSIDAHIKYVDGILYVPYKHEFTGEVSDNFQPIEGE